ncbi:MFS transporter [bacterium]|nr:MFS transporter [bacterium]
MEGIFKRTLAPNIALILVMIGVSYLSTFLSLRMTADGYPLFYTGILYSGYCAGMMIGALYLKKIIFIKGHIRSFSIFATTISLIILFQSFSLLPELWIFYRFLTGIAAAGLFIVIESWILLLCHQKNRGIAIAIYMFAIYLGQCIGQYGLGLVPINSILPFNLAIIFCIASIIPIASMNCKAPSLHESKPLHAIALMKKIPLGFLGNFTSGLILSAFFSLMPVFGRHEGYSLLQIATIMSVTIFGGMLLQWPIGKLSDTVPRRVVIILDCLLIFLFSILLCIYYKHSYFVLLQLLFLLGGCLFTLYPISITYCCDFYDASGLTCISAAALLYYGVGCIIGPIIASAFMLFAPFAIFIYFALFSALLGIFAIYRSQKAPTIAEKNKENYQAHPGIQENFSEID